MQTPYGLETTDRTNASARRLKSDLADGVKNVKNAASGEIQNLIRDVEDLIGRVADIKDPDIARLRDKVEGALAGAKDAIGMGTQSVRRRVREAVGTTDDLVRDNPWGAVGTAALIGLAVGFLVSRRS